MGESFEFDQADWITAGAIGEPGQRTFSIQARKDDILVALHAEKSQVRWLADLAQELLGRIGVTVTPDDLDEEGQRLVGELEPLWRVGSLSLGMDPEGERFLLELEELPVDDAGAAGPGVPGGEEAGGAEPGLPGGEAGGPESAMPGGGEPGGGEPGGGPEPATAALWMNREQLVALAAYAAYAVEAGARERCRLCSRPIDPAGHVCPALNGHGQLSV